MPDTTMDCVLYMNQDGTLHLGMPEEASGPGIPMQLTVPAGASEATAMAESVPDVNDVDLMRAVATRLNRPVTANLVMEWQKVPGGYARIFKLSEAKS
jgi:hypothetical protein